MQPPPVSALLPLTTEQVVRMLWLGRARVLPVTLLFAGLGIVTALLMQPEFRSEARLMPEMATNSGDVLKRLASVAGFAGADFSDENTDAVRPDLYPNIVQSTPFVLYLIGQRVTTTDGSVKTIGQFLWDNANRWLLPDMMRWNSDDAIPAVPVKSAGTLRLTDRQHALAEEIGERVTAQFDTRSGIITITARMPDANAAATTAQLTMNYLTQYVRNYRTEKARQDLYFYGQQLAEARKRFHAAQLKLFQYDDGHKNVVILATTMNRQRMEAELTIAQRVYTELAGQYEQLKVKVQTQTPIFKLLEPPKVPFRRASPRRTVVVLLFAMAGLGVGSLYVLARQRAFFERIHALFLPGKDKTEYTTQPL